MWNLSLTLPKVTTKILDPSVAVCLAFETLKSTYHTSSFIAGGQREIHDLIPPEAQALLRDQEMGSSPLYSFFVIVIIMLFLVAFLGILTIDRQTDVLLYGSSCVLLCHWLVTSSG